jgi:methyl-accepting chemotaxis protein
VKGDRLSAQEILEAEIDVDGDVVVLGGVLGANIKAGGNFRGRYVHSANIQVAGDVLVETEVMDSTIITGGRCIVERGKILASSIFSKQGVRAPEIGSGACKACSLTVGVDEITDRETDRLRTQIVEKEKRQRDLKAHRDGLQEKSGKLNADLGDLAQVQDRNMVQQRTLQEKMDALRKLEDREQLAEVEASMASLDSQIRENESRLDRMLDEQDGMTHKISESQNEIDTLQGEIEKLKEEIESFEGWSRAEKGSPVIRVSGKVFAGTVIRGLRSSLILQEDYEHVLIAETRVNTPDSGSEWKMVVSPLK